MKSKLESLFVIIIMLLSIANIKFCADAITRLSDNTEKTYIAQSEIKSKQYLVTDEYISRISPKTMVESFVMQLGLENKEIAIYTDHDKTEEVKDGLIKTGMVMTVKSPEEETETKENIAESEQEKVLEEPEEKIEQEQEESNKQEEIVKETEYELSVVGDTNKDGNANIVEVVQIINHLAGFEGKEITGIELVSSDVNGDSEVNLIDIDKIIRYIVFEELEIGEVGAPKTPIIEVSGQENNGWYNEDTKVTIKTLEEEFKKTVYMIDGDTFETTNKEEEKTIKQNGTHKIEAYTYGISENKSIVEEKEIKIDKEAPIVEIIKGEETSKKAIVKIEARDELSGLEEEGYSFDGGATWQKENAKEYTSNQKIEIQVRDKAGNIAKESVEINNINKEKNKYNVVFKNYDGTTLQEEELEEGSMPKYKGETPSKAEDNTYTYEFAGWDKEVTEVTGNTEYTATYRETYKNYTVIFKDADGKELSRKEDYHYGDTVEVPETPTKAEDNTYTYEFAGWDKEVTQVTGNEEYTATYREVYKNYTVIFKNADGKELSRKEDYHYGDTVEVPEAPTKEKTGYTCIFKGWDKEVTQVTENTEYIATFSEEIIEYSITYELNGGIVEDNPTTYNIETQNFTLNTPEREGYKFIGWTLDEGQEKELVVTIQKGSTGNRKYIANWEKLPEVAMIEETGTKYQTVQEAINAAENGQTVAILENVRESITNEKEIKLNLNGKELKNLEESNITIVNKGTLTIINKNEEKEGKIINDIGTAIVNGANALLNMGNKEDEVSNEPYVEGKTLGIENKGTFNFYDGTIRGIKAIEGTINEKAEGYNALIGKTEDDTKQEATLRTLGEAVARIDNNYYVSLKAALNSLVKGNDETEETQTTITMLKSVVITNEINIEKYMNVRIDLNSNEISANLNTKQMIKNQGKLEITDLSEEKVGEIKSTLNKILIDNVSGATLNVTGGAITATGNYSNGTGISNSGTVTITGGTITGGNYGTGIDNSGTVEITGGTITTTGNYGNGSVISNSGTVTITGGTIKATRNNGHGIDNTGTVEITGGTITSTNGTGIDNSGTVEITGGIVTGYGNGVYNSGEGTVEIAGGTITGGNYGAGISNTGTVEITGGTITTTGRDSCGISNSGTITLGTNDKGVYPTNYPNENKEETYPIIKGNKYGIYNTGIFNYYDGIIFANSTSLNAIYGAVSRIEENFDIMYKDSEEHYVILGQAPMCRILDTNNNVVLDENGNELTYNNIKEAFASCPNEHTIQITRKTNGLERIEIEKDKKIKIDLNNNEIKVLNKEGLVKNYGNLEIADLSEEKSGEIISEISDRIIENNGELNISSGTIKATGNRGHGIDNTGTVKIAGGEITANGSGGHGISNSGIVEITGGTIIGYSYGIENNGTGKVNVSGGTIGGISNNGTLEVTGGIIKAPTIYVDGRGISNSGTVEITGGTITGYYGISNIGTVEITGGTVTGSSYGVYNSGEGTVEIAGGTVTGNSNGISNSGTVDITGGTIKGGNYGISNSGTLEVTGGEITATERGSYGISNTGTVEITGGTVTGYGYGISNGGTVKITGGTITGYNGISNSGTVTLGTNDKVVYPSAYPTENKEETYPIIKGNTNGIYNTGTFNYYDGIIFANSTSSNAIYGAINDTAKIYNESDEIVGTYDVSYKDVEKNEEQGIEEAHYAILRNDPICKVIDDKGNTLLNDQGNQMLYYNFGKAISDCQANYTIQIIRTLNCKNKIEIAKGKNIKLDLNGNKITAFNSEGFIINNGSLEILDSTESKTGSINSTQSINTIENNGILEIAGGTITATGRDSRGISNSGTLEVIGGTITATGNSGHGIDNTGTLEVTGGTIKATESNGYGISNSGTVEITGGEITATGNSGHGIDNTGTLEVTGGTIKATGRDSYGISNSETGTVEIAGGTIKATESNGYGISNSGTVEITGGTITGKYAIKNFGKGTVEIIGGTIEGYNYVTRNYGYGISNSGTVEITGGTIKATGRDSCGIYNSGTLEVTGGTIKATSTPTILSYYCGGISNSGTLEITGGKIKSNNDCGISNSSGTINIGSNDGKILVDSPEIKSNSTYGIKNENGTVNFYDGAIIGKAAAVYGSITNMPEGYRIKSEIKTIELIEGLQVYTLEKSGTDTSEASVGGIYYDSLQEAINSCTDEKDMIILERNITTQEVITIAEGQTITIDLNGFTITGTIQNNGILNITNSKGNVENESYGTITGNGTVNVK